MELRHLRYFVYVAEELHFGRAAERAGIAQPPLSQQIRSLEAELGVPLFHRTNRRVALTDAGKALLPEARRVLRDADRAISVARDGGRGIVGRVRLGFIGSLAFGFLPRFMQHHRDMYPGVQVDLREMTSEQQRVAITEDALDLGLVRYPMVSGDLVSELLYQESLCVALPAEHPLVSKERIEIGQLARETFIIFPRHLGPVFHDQVIGLCRDAGFSPRVGQQAIQMPTTVSLVAAGSGVAIVPGSMRALRLEGVAYRPVLMHSGDPAQVGVYLVTSARTTSGTLANTVALARSATQRFPQRL